MTHSKFLRPKALKKEAKGRQLGGGDGALGKGHRAPSHQLGGLGSGVSSPAGCR